MARRADAIPRVLSTLAGLVTALASAGCGDARGMCAGSECEGTTGRSTSAVTCDPALEVYPVCGPHNGGYDGAWSNFTCPPHPGHSPDGSDFIGGDHFGNDIFGARGTPIVAARAGTIVNAGPTGVGGNRVTIVDGCGWYYYYAHLDSITAWGGAVGAGTQIGTLGNTGADWTAPHLHFSIYPDGCYSCGIDPFPYLQSVDHLTGCECACECSPGQTQSRGCGACAEPSAVCGAQSRACGGDCRWSAWSACAGPDPEGGHRACDTGELGQCADGRVRCVAGCLGCVRLHDPSEERCDDIDTNCNGEVDEGHPTQMGAVAPAHAARLTDFGHPSSIRAAESARAWVCFANVGREAWRPGAVWLGSLSAAHGQVSALYAQGQWASWDVAAVLDRTVRSGETGCFEFGVRVPSTARGSIVEEFGLHGPSGAMMKCPEPTFAMKVAVALDAHPGPDAGSGQPSGRGQDIAMAEGGCGCVAAGSRGLEPGAWLAVLAWLARRRRAAPP
jgi:hypothetical protein